MEGQFHTPLWGIIAAETSQIVAVFRLCLVLVWCNNNSLQSSFESRKVNN